MNTILRTQNLTKRYGRLTAVSELDVIVEKGQVFGLLGPNGSGKTTTLGMLLQVVNPTHGQVDWFGQPANANLRRNIGAILETPNFYPYLSAYDNLKIVAKIKETDTARIDQVLEEVGLLSRKADKFKTYSLGMKQRLAIGSALLANPDVLILDEPTNGLDPQGIVEIRNLILKIAATGKTIILASHLLSEVQKVCTHFMVLKKGLKIHQGSVSDVEKQENEIQVGAKDMSFLKEVLSKMKGIRKIDELGTYYALLVDPELTVEHIAESLAKHGITASHLLEKNTSIEDQFIKLMKES